MTSIFINFSRVRTGGYVRGGFSEIRCHAVMPSWFSERLAIHSQSMHTLPNLTSIALYDDITT